MSKRYLTPFGASRGSSVGTWPDDKRFLGKTSDVNTALTHIGAREYDPYTGQFLSVDPLLSLDQHQSLNGYNYANNNPITFSDPTGLRPDGVCGGNSSTCTPSDSLSGASVNHHESWQYAGTSGWNWTSWIEDKKEKSRRYENFTSVTWTNLTPRGLKFSRNTIPGMGRYIASTIDTFNPLVPLGVSAAGAYDSAMEGLGVDTSDPAYEDGEMLVEVGTMVLGGAAATAAKKGVRKICHSFIPGTEVLMADGSRKAIEDIETGDVVFATDPETGESYKKTVLETIRTEDDKDFTELTVATDDGPASIVATDTHPFWVPELNEWVNAGNLQVGNYLRTSAGNHVKIVELNHYTKRQRTHDLTIDDVHTYYVLAGATPVLVHNCGGGTTVYRGVSEVSGQTGGPNPAFDDAVEGIARPRGGDSTPEMHHRGMTDSDHTSWSTNPAAAIRAATRGGGSGVVIRGTIPSGRPHVHVNDQSWVEDDLRGEAEVIIQGVMRGQSRAAWPGARLEDLGF